MEGLSGKNLVFLDESSVNLGFTRNYARAKKGKRVKEGVIDTRYKRKSIIAVIQKSGVSCPWVFSGTLNKERFADYIKTKIKPTLTPNDVLVLDNSSVHKSKLVLDTLEECGINYQFLPRYSPDFNPIE